MYAINADNYIEHSEYLTMVTISPKTHFKLQEEEPEDITTYFTPSEEESEEESEEDFFSYDFLL